MPLAAVTCGRNRHRQLGIDQGNPRHQPIVAEAFLEGRIVRGDDRVLRGLGARARRGRHGQHRQRRPDDLQPAADVLQIVLDRRDSRRLVAIAAVALARSMAAPPPMASRKSPSAAPMAANLGGRAIHVGHFRLVQEGGQRDRFDAFGPQRGGNFAHHARGHLGRQSADQKGPAAERSPQRPTSRRRPQPKTIRGGARKS